MTLLYQIIEAGTRWDPLVDSFRGGWHLCDQCQGQLRVIQTLEEVIERVTA
jgi:hypothetical protein